MKENYLFNIGENVMLKDNLLIVTIKSCRKKMKVKKYEVFYTHLEEPHTFYVNEEDLKEIPCNYDQLIFNAYVEYRHKYDELLERLRIPAFRDKY